MSSRDVGLLNGIVKLEGGWSTGQQRRKAAAPVVGGSGSKASLRFQGSSVSVWGLVRPSPGSRDSTNARATYRCVVDGIAWSVTTHAIGDQGLARLCQSPQLSYGEHTSHIEVEEASGSEVVLEHFTINEEARLLEPRAVVTVKIINVVVMGPDVSTINGVRTTVGYKPIDTRRITTVLPVETSSSPTYDAYPTPDPPPLTPDPPSPTPEPPTSETPPTTPTPPPPITPTTPNPVSTPPPPNLAPSPSSSSSSASAGPIENLQPNEASQITFSTSESYGFATYTMTRPPEESATPADTSAGSAKVGEDGRRVAPGAVVGIVMGLLVLLAAAVIVGTLWYLRKRRRQARPRLSNSAVLGTSAPMADSSRDTPSLGLFPTDGKVGELANTESSQLGAGSDSGTLTSHGAPASVAYNTTYGFLLEDPVSRPVDVRSDDGQSAISPPAYYGRPPTYHERQSATHSQPGYF